MNQPVQVQVNTLLEVQQERINQLQQENIGHVAVIKTLQARIAELEAAATPPVAPPQEG